MRILLVILYPVCWPISRILDRLLGHAQGLLFRRKQLESLVELHSKHESYGGELSKSEVEVIKGALELSSKTAGDCLTPIDKVFMVDTSQKLDDAFYE